jgi:predicted component of type VI protein secretion system
MHTAVALGSLETLALFITAISQAAKTRLGVPTSKLLAQVLAMSQLVTAILDVVGQTIRRIARLLTKVLADLRLVVRKILTTAQTTQTVAATARRAAVPTVVAFVPMIAAAVLVVAGHGLLVVQVLTIRIVALDPIIQGIAQACTVQRVAARHHAVVSTIPETVTASLGATGRPQSH